MTDMECGACGEEAHTIAVERTDDGGAFFLSITVTCTKCGCKTTYRPVGTFEVDWNAHPDSAGSLSVK